jgi:Mrp family chromosome partitioning ATPase
MTTSMLDQKLFNLSCGHTVVLGRLENQSVWTCETCSKKTDLTAEPHKKTLEHDLDTATQIDLQAKQRGEAVIRLG